jgi:diacylglycerol kinase family enzyme
MRLDYVVIVFNPNAGSTNIQEVKFLRDEFARHCRVELKPTTAEPESARRLAARAYADGASLVVAYGGDYTAREVSLGAGKRWWAPFHGGTGNVFIDSFRPKPSREQFVQSIVEGWAQALDTIALEYVDVDEKVYSGPALVGVGFGDMSDAISDANPEMKRIFGKTAYATGMTRAAFTPASVTFRVDAEGGRFIEKATSVFVLNVLPPSLAALSRGCNASDGLLDVVAITADSPIQLAGVAIDFAAGTPEKNPYFLRLRSSMVTVTASKPVRPNIDGDPAEATLEVHMRADRAAMNVLVGP